jgi:hypothetical protein
MLWKLTFKVNAFLHGGGGGDGDGRYILEYAKKRQNRSRATPLSPSHLNKAYTLLATWGDILRPRKT